jgi:type 1 glutamine amidotransferase
MNRFASSLVLLGVLLVAAATPAADDSKVGKKAGAVKVLILSGVPETHHEYKNQSPNLAKILQEQGHDVTLRDKAIIEEGDSTKFDVLVLMSEKWRGDEKNRQELLQLVKDGKGLVAIHMAYVPCVEALAGKASRNGKTGDLKIEIADKKHPVTQGVTDFTAGPKDELYAGVKFMTDDVQVLAKGQDTAGTWEPVAWVRSYGKGRVFYTSLGHSTESQKNLAFLKLVTNAVRWAGAIPESK